MEKDVLALPDGVKTLEYVNNVPLVPLLLIVFVYAQILTNFSQLTNGLALPALLTLNQPQTRQDVSVKLDLFLTMELVLLTVKIPKL